MPIKFWENIGEGLAQMWNARTLTPAIAFWGGALMAWCFTHGWSWIDPFLKVSTPTGVVTIVATLFLIASSSAVVHWLTMPAIRLAEGYWPWPFKGLRFWCTKKVLAAIKKKEDEWARIAEKITTTDLSIREVDRYACLENELGTLPVERNLCLPTRLGNVLRAAEEYPQRCYGLDTAITWPRLWVTLPETTRKEISQARQVLDESTQLLIWGTLFAIWCIWAWWAVLVSLAVIITAYFKMLSCSSIYAQLLRTTYDVHRFDLYEALKWPTPVNPHDEKAYGELLTVFLLRGVIPDGLQYKT